PTQANSCQHRGIEKREACLLNGSGLFPGGPDPPGQTGHDGREFGRVNGLGHVHLEARGERPEPVLATRVGRQRHGRNAPSLLMRERPNLPDQCVTVFHGHADVRDEDVWVPVPEHFKRLPHRPGGPHFGPALPEDGLEEFAGFRLVIHDERAHPGQFKPQPVRHWPFDRAGEVGQLLTVRTVLTLLYDCEREADDEGRPLPHARALGGDRPAVQLRQVSRNRQAEAEAALFARDRAVGLAEALEDVRQEVPADALPGVADRDLDVRVDPRERDLHAAPFGRELDRVREQVPDDLLQAVRVTLHQILTRAEYGLQTHAPGVSRRADRLDRVLYDAGDLDRRDFQPEFARNDSRDVEDVLDDLPLRHGALLNRLDGAPPALVVKLPDAQHPRPAEDAVERVAQFVRDGGEELILQAVGLLGLGPRLARRLVEPGVVHRNRRLPGQPRDDALVPFGEDARLRVAEEEPTQHLARARDDRQGEVTRHGQVPLGHPEVWRVLPVARVLLHVVYPDDAFTAEGRAEEVGGTRHREVGEVFARHARERVEHV